MSPEARGNAERDAHIIMLEGALEAERNHSNLLEQERNTLGWLALIGWLLSILFAVIYFSH